MLENNYEPDVKTVYINEEPVRLVSSQDQQFRKFYNIDFLRSVVTENPEYNVSLSDWDQNVHIGDLMHIIKILSEYTLPLKNALVIVVDNKSCTINVSCYPIVESA